MAGKRKPKLGNREENINQLESAMGHLTPEEFTGTMKRDRLYTMRISEQDRRSMEMAAKACELSTAEYLLRLHRIALKMLEGSGLIHKTGIYDARPENGEPED